MRNCGPNRRPPHRRRPRRRFRWRFRSPNCVPPPQPLYPAELAKPDRSRFALAIVSLALGIPLTAIATRTSGVIGLILTWVGIVAVNAVYGWTGRSHS